MTPTICLGCTNRPREEHTCEDAMCFCGYVECIKRQTELAKEGK